MVGKARYHAGRCNLAEVRVGKLDDRLACLHMGIGQHILDAVDLAVRHFMARQDLLDVGQWQTFAPVGHEGIDFVAALHALARRGQFVAFEQIGPAHGVEDAAVGCPAGSHDRQPVAVLRGKDIGQCGIGGARSGAFSDKALVLVFHRQGVEHTHQCLGRRQVDFAASGLAWLTADTPCQCRGDREGAEQARHHIAQRVVHVLRRAPRLPRQMSEPAHGLKDARKAGAPCIGAALAKAGQAQHDQVWVVGMQRRQVQAPSVQRTRAKVFHQHIEVGQHLEQQRLAFGFAHVQRDAALAAVGHLPKQRVLAHDGQHVAQGVAAVGQFELGDLRAHIPAQGRGKRCGHHRGHVQNAYALQRPRACGRRV